MSKTFNDGLEEGVTLLSNFTHTTRGEHCSAAELRKVAGPSFTNKLFIAKLREARKKSGTYKAGVQKAIDVIEGFQVQQDPGGTGAWVLVEIDTPDVWQTLYTVELKRILNPDG